MKLSKGKGLPLDFKWQIWVFFYLFILNSRLRENWGTPSGFCFTKDPVLHGTKLPSLVVAIAGTWHCSPLVSWVVLRSWESDSAVQTLFMAAILVGVWGTKPATTKKNPKPKLPPLLFPQCFTSYNPVCSFIPLLLGTVQSCCCHLVPYCLVLYSNCNRSCTKT